LKTKPTKSGGFLTGHDLKAAQFGLPKNLLTACQRQGAVPREIRDFKPEDDQFLGRLALAFKNPRLLQIQLHQFQAEKKLEIIASADDAMAYSNWERRALKMIEAQYREVRQDGQRPTADTIEVMDILQHSYEIKNSMKNRRRLQELRKIAFKRIFGKERR
jgi:hypothetical protein